jgi:tRNA (guanine-N7-)-methyltransferase
VKADRVAEYQEEVVRRRVLVREFARGVPNVQDRPLVWELGCGHGHFLNAYAAAHPERLCIGVDLVAERVARAQRKCNRQCQTNLFFCRSEARLFLEEWPEERRFDSVFILFPDPWPKSRHHKHRILQPEFLSLLGARCEAGRFSPLSHRFSAVFPGNRDNHFGSPGLGFG